MLCLLLAASNRQSVQNNLIQIQNRGSKSPAVVAPSGQSMDVDVAGNSQVAIGTCSTYVKPLPNQHSEARSYIKPAQGNFIDKDSGGQLSLAAKSPSHATSTIHQCPDARSNMQPAVGTFRNEDSAMQWSHDQVPSTSVLDSGIESKSYIRPAQGNLMHSARPASTSLHLLSNPGFHPGGVWGTNKAMLGMDMEWVPYNNKAPGSPGSLVPAVHPNDTSVTKATTHVIDMELGPYYRRSKGTPGPSGGSEASPGSLVPSVQPRHTSVTKATTNGVDMDWVPYNRKTTGGTPGFPPSGGSEANPGSLVLSGQPRHTSVTKATTRTPSAKRPLEESLSEGKRSGSEPTAKRRRADQGSLVSVVPCVHTPIAKATARTAELEDPHAQHGLSLDN